MTLPQAQQWGVTEKAARFVRAIAELGNNVAACKVAGVDSSYGQLLLQDPRVQVAIAAEVRRKLAIGGALGVRVLLELAEKGQSERVRADCAKALVDRAGFVAPRAAAPGAGLEKTLNEMSIAELKDLAAKLEDEIAGRATPLNSPPNTQAAAQVSELLD